MQNNNSLNQAILTQILNNLREGNIKPCLRLGFSEDELKEINQLSFDEIYDMTHTHVPFATVTINHEVFWKMVTLARVNSEERRIIDRALMLGASIQMLNSYFGLTTSEVSSRRHLLGKEEPMGRKPAASEEQQEAAWHLWQIHKNPLDDHNTLAGLEALMLIAEETDINLTEVWKLVTSWQKK
ncbi:DUF2857 domain-containing protein [Pasteurella testudinis]|uniref:DUF2857 domain-containing protein n=1 Tax=Pasteurella testudinis TaxID=761 RepID=UPI0040589C54